MLSDMGYMHTVWFNLYKIFKCNLFLLRQEKIRGCLELGGRDQGREEGKDYKAAGGNFDGNGNVNFLDCGDGFIGAYICSYLSNYKL